MSPACPRRAGLETLPRADRGGQAAPASRRHCSGVTVATRRKPGRAGRKTAAPPSGSWRPTTAWKVVLWPTRHSVAPGGRRRRQQAADARVERVAGLPGRGQQVLREPDAAEGQPRGVASAAVGAREHGTDGDPQRPQLAAERPRLLAPRPREVALARAVGVVARLAVVARVARRVAKGHDEAAGAQLVEQAPLGGRERGARVVVAAPAAAAGEDSEDRETHEQGRAPHGARSSAAPTIVSASIPWWR